MNGYRVPTVALALAVSSVLALPGTPSTGSPAVDSQLAAAALPTGTRIGFTDEQDALYQVGVTREQEEPSDTEEPEELAVTYDTPGNIGPPGGLGATTGFEADPVHEAELSVAADGLSTVFVSTREDDAGEIYIDYSEDDSGTEPIRITCDEFVEAHPVVDGPHVLFASNADGDWDIWLGTGPAPPEPPPPARPAPGWSAAAPAAPSRGAVNAAPVSEPCGKGWNFRNLTGPGPDDDQDQWPTVAPGLPDGDGSGQVVFTRSTDDELSDLWRIQYDDGEWLDPERLLQEATPDVAETHPRIVRFTAEDNDTEEWVVHTSTQARHDGSLMLRRLSDPEELYNPWRGQHLQSSEAAWDGSTGRPVIAFRSTGPWDERDPLGDIWLAELAWEPQGTGSGEPSLPVFTNVTRVVDDPRIAESHPAFRTRFFGGGATQSSELVFTARALRGLHQETTRIVDGDVSDVLATDGSDRTVLADHEEDVEFRPFRYHETAPSFTRDGSRMVYAKSDNNRASGSQGFGELLVVADADGTNPVSLGDSTGHQLHDVDSDPEWSPDGTRIAFVRHRPGEFRHVLVYDVEAEEVTVVTQVAAGDTAAHDADPSWSPDGERLVVARIQWDFYEQPSGQQLWVVPADGAGIGLPVAWPCEGPCRVAGRRPAWSPDGQQIAFELEGELLLVDVEGDGFGFLMVSEPRPVVGVDWSGEAPAPTEARYVVETADDPAWAPDGSEIAFAGQPVGQPDQRGIWAVRPDGSGLRLVTDERGPETEPAYRPVPPEDLRDPAADVLVRVKLDEEVGYVGGKRTATVTVRNRGPNTAESVALRGIWPDHLTPAAPEPDPPAAETPACLPAGSPCPLGDLAPGQVVRYDVVLTARAEGTGKIVARVSTLTPDPVPANNRAVVALPVLQPTIRLVPAVARPGQVVMAYGEDMPPGTDVSLLWSEGTVPEPGTLRVAADGTARTSILFLRRDQLGVRILTATSTTEEFTPVAGEILVTLRSMSPPDLVGRG